MSNFHDRYRAMKKDLGLNNEMISSITGNTQESLRVITSKSNNIPRWLRLAVWIYEKYLKNDPKSERIKALEQQVEALNEALKNVLQVK